jgi:hypothetical protein
MWTLLRRTIVPAVLFVGGVSMLVYGGRFHITPVVEETVEETTLKIPNPLWFTPIIIEQYGGLGVLGEDGMPDPNSALAADYPPETVKKKIKSEVTKQESEPALIREVTFGGVVLKESGAIWRTYTGEAPSLCPT